MVGNRDAREREDGGVKVTAVVQNDPASPGCEYVVTYKHLNVISKKGLKARVKEIHAQGRKELHAR